MKKLTTILFCFSTFIAMAQKDTVPTLKSILLEQLKTTHTVKDWFVPINIAIEGLTAEQANWTDGKGNHSIGQLTAHLIFWNERLLKQFRGQPLPDYGGNNDETFTSFDKNSWDTTVKKIDEVLTQLENEFEKADETKLAKWYSTIAHVGTHNAYHTGQIIYIRKLLGSWDDKKGVK